MGVSETFKCSTFLLLIEQCLFVADVLPKSAGPCVLPETWKCVCVCAYMHACTCVLFHPGNSTHFKFFKLYILFNIRYLSHFTFPKFLGTKYLV